MPGLGTVEMEQVLYRLFDAYEAKCPESTSSILDACVFSDLEILCGPADDVGNHVFRAIDYTITAAGSIQLQRLLYEPVTDSSLLERRQAIVSILLGNASLLQALDMQLQRVKGAESDILWFWKNIQSMVRNLTEVAQIASCFGINKSPFASECWKWGFSVLLPPCVSLSTSFAISSMGSMVVGPLIGYFPWISGVVSSGLGVGLKGLHMTGSLYNTVQKEKMINHLRKILHSKMNAVAALCSASKVMGAAMHEYTAFNTLFPHAEDLSNIVDQPSPDSKALLDLLETNTFNEEPSFWSRQGRVIVAFNLMREVKDSFVRTMKIIGQLDAYVSIAKLYKKYARHPQAHFSFVQYQHADKPHLELTNFWHPTLNPDTVVVNSIELGAGGTARSAVITGPNAGGKSITLKSITLCILLAQTIGIVPADAMTFTPFSSIKTYMKMTDTVGSASLYQAEVRRSNELLQATKTLAATKAFAFLASDELLTGTSMASGEAGAYGYASVITSLDNVIAVFATHFKGLTKLAQDTNGLVANYKVSIEYQPDGSYISPYTIVPGISNQDIGLDVIRQEHADPAVLKAAYAFLKRKQEQQGLQHAEEPATLQVAAAVAA
jgi:DNA mismatch repair ATPase MutS